MHHMDYAKCDGDVTLKRLVKEEEEETLCKAMSIFKNFDYGWNDKLTTSLVFHSDYGYYEDKVLNALHTLEQFDIERGEVNYRGEDGSIWRFIYRNGEWHKEKGHIEYYNIKTKRLINALMTYVADDLAVTETEYVRDKLLDMCGLTNDELKEIGLGYLLDEEED